MTDIEKYKNYIENSLEKINKTIKINGKKCFILCNDIIIHIDVIKYMNSIVVEYADNMDEAKINRFEDGDVFYVDEYDESGMLDSILKEINSCF